LLSGGALGEMATELTRAASDHVAHGARVTRQHRIAVALQIRITVPTKYVG
jgi:hypothetical protein